MQAIAPAPLAPRTIRGYERRPLFKSDYPRTIDRYIDYFEGAPAADADTGRACGETLLDRLA
jgi:hypothetical protein